MSKSHARDSRGNFLCGSDSKDDYLSRSWWGVDCEDCLEMKPSMGTVIEKVKAYLDHKERRKAPGGDWAEVREGDVFGLWDIIREILQVKFESDVDGDLPLEVDIVDRNKCHSNHYMAVPYAHKAGTEDDRMKILRILQGNAHIANKDLDLYINQLLDLHREKEDDAERNA